GASGRPSEGNTAVDPTVLHVPARVFRFLGCETVRYSASALLTMRASGRIETPLIGDRKSTRLNSSHLVISYAVFCLKKKNTHIRHFHRWIPHSSFPSGVRTLLGSAGEALRTGRRAFSPGQGLDPSLRCILLHMRRFR